MSQLMVEKIIEYFGKIYILVNSHPVSYDSRYMSGQMLHPNVVTIVGF